VVRHDLDRKRSQSMALPATAQCGHGVGVTALGVKQPPSARDITTSPRPAFVFGRVSRRRRRASCLARNSSLSLTIASTFATTQPALRIGDHPARSPFSR